MDKNLKPVIFLMADDDPDDRLLIKEAFQGWIPILYKEDGVELIDCAYRTNFQTRQMPTPDLS
jgi:hypothetical protein